MSGYHGLVNEMVADRHGQYLREAEQRRLVRRSAEPRNRWTRGFVTRVRDAFSSGRRVRDAETAPALTTRLMEV